MHRNIVVFTLAATAFFANDGSFRGLFESTPLFSKNQGAAMMLQCSNLLFTKIAVQHFDFPLIKSVFRWHFC